MSRLLYQQGTQQQAENIIVREQKDFSGGMFKDIPDIPENAVAGLENWINRGTHLEGRSGSIQYSATVLPVLRGGTIHATKSGNTITVSDDGYFNEEDVGDFFVWSDGVNEKITGYINSSSATVESYTAHSEDSNAYMRARVNGLYFHRSQAKIVLHIGSKLYWSPSSSIVWTEILRNCNETIGNSESHFEEYDNFVYVYNTSGIFKCDLSETIPIFFIVNSSNVPQTLIYATPQAAGSSYKYRYVYTLSRISGAWTGNRMSAGAVVELESSANGVSSTTLIDYKEGQSSSEISASNYMNVGYFELPFTVSGYKTQAQYTHFSVYRTLDIGSNGIDPTNGAGNNSEIYIWVEDIPIAPVWVGSKTGTTVTLTSGTITSKHIGMIVTSSSGGTFGAIQSITNPTTFEVYSSGSVVSGALIAGNSMSTSVRTSVCNQSGTSLTWVSGQKFITSLAGSTVFFSDGTTGVVSAYVSENELTLTTSSTKSGVGIAIVDDPNGRYYSTLYHDTTTDEILRVRQLEYSLKTRFSLPLPSSNLGAISNGFMFSALADDNKLYYCSITQGSESLAGCYNPVFQYASFKDKIKLLKVFKDKLIVFCKQSTHEIPTNTFDSIDNEVLGETTITISGQNIIDEKIGVDGPGSIQLIDRNSAVLVTSEPSIRVFDGAKYSDSLSSNRIEKDLANFNGSYSSAYTQQGGYYLFAKDSADKTYNLAIYDNQGAGFSEVTGTTPFPEFDTGTLSVYNANDKRCDLVLDYSTGKFYNISTYNGYSGSGIYKCWRDKVTSTGIVSGMTLTAGQLVRVTCTSHGLSTGATVTFYDVGGTTELNGNTYIITVPPGAVNYFDLNSTDASNFTTYTSGGHFEVGGYSIEPTVRFGADKGTFEHYFIDHAGSHFYFRPDNDAVGYPNSLEVDMSIYVDGEPTTATAISEDIQKTHEAVYEEVISGNRLQTEVSANVSNIILVGRQQYYNSKDVPAAPADRIVSTASKQALVCDTRFWFTRPNVLVDRVTGATIAGVGYSGNTAPSITLTTGVDGNSTSAMSFTTSYPDTGILLGSFDYTSDTLQYIVSYWRSGTVELRWSDGSRFQAFNVYDYGTHNGWTLSYGYINVEDSYSVGFSGSGAAKLCDIRYYNNGASGTVDTSLLEYLYNDMVRNSGNSTLPLA